MNEMTPFERQVEHELHAMIGPIPVARLVSCMPIRSK